MKKLQPKLLGLLTVLIILMGLFQWKVVYADDDAFLLGISNLIKNIHDPYDTGKYAVHYKEKPDWTFWNKVLLGGAVGGAGADVGSTIYQLSGDSKCQEANHYLVGKDPNAGILILLKAVMIGGTNWVANQFESSEKRQIARNIFNGLNTVLGFFAFGHNMSLDCK